MLKDKKKEDPLALMRRTLFLLVATLMAAMVVVSAVTALADYHELDSASGRQYELKQKLAGMGPLDENCRYHYDEYGLYYGCVSSSF